MHLVYGIAGIAFTVYKGNLHLRVIDQQPEQLTTGIPGATYNTYFYFLTHKTGLKLFPLIILFHRIPDRSLVAKYLTEPTYIFACKAGIHFTILAKLAAHKIVG